MKNRRKIAMLVAVVLALLLIIPMFLTALLLLFPPAEAAVTQNDIDNRKKSISSITEQKKKIREDINALKADINGVLALIKAYDEQLTLNEQAKEETSELIQLLNIQIADQQLALDGAVRAKEERQKRFQDRLRAMDRMEEVSYIGVLLEAQSFSDLLTRWDDIREMLGFDQKIIDELAEAELEVAAQRAALDAQRQDLYRYSDELAEAELEIAAQRKEKQELYSSLHSTEEYLYALEREADEDMRKEQEELAELIELKRKQDEEAKRKNQYVGGVMLWPVPGYTRISSPFGSRSQPTPGASTNHKGIDIPANSGTPIVAANSGTIIIRKYSSGYGNYIAIDHGGNMATLYGHMSKFGSFQVGASVKKGDVIGYVGTTGVSTGNHLHFEVIKNGTQVDPIPYLKP